MTRVRLTPDNMAFGGEAVARLDGRVVFVRGGIPGEPVMVTLTGQRRGQLHGVVEEVIAPSPDRVAPLCRHFGTAVEHCGGCQWQHIAYPAQLVFKRAILIEQLRRIGGVAAAPVRPVLASPQTWGHRHQARFALTQSGLGYRGWRSSGVVGVVECPVLHPALAARLSHPATSPTDSAAAEVQLRATGDATGPTATSGVVTRSVAGRAFKVSPRSFFQANPGVTELLLAEVLTRVAVAAGHTVLDGYCGVGLFAASLAPVADRVVAVESDPSALGDAAHNLADYPNVALRPGRMQRVVQELEGGFDGVVVDPPRAGCQRPVIDALVRWRVPRLVYVSCDPATLARDTRLLIAGGYQLEAVQPLDMFPHTYHVEAVATFIGRFT